MKSREVSTNWIADNYPHLAANRGYQVYWDLAFVLAYHTGNDVDAAMARIEYLCRDLKQIGGLELLDYVEAKLNRKLNVKYEIVEHYKEVYKYKYFELSEQKKTKLNHLIGSRIALDARHEDEDVPRLIRDTETQLQKLLYSFPVEEAA